MELLKLKLSGFRRFESSSIDLLGRLVAIVGPNEAGKSSILEALTRLNTDEPLADLDLTRGTSPAEGATILSARFVLDGDDKAAIDHIPEARSASQFLVTKRRNGQRRGRLEPAPVRQLGPRLAARRLLSRIAQSRWAHENEELLEELWPEATSILASDAQTLSADHLSKLQELADRLNEEPQRTNPARLRSALIDLSAIERAPHPHDTAAKIVMSRVPEFLLFGDVDRSFASVYDLATTADDPPAALGNFANLAGLDLRAARDFAARGDFGELETLQRASNDVLRDVFSSGWRQSVMSVQVRLDRAELRPIVQNLSGRFTELGERSDGLRIFVALVAYLAREMRPVPPILLVDEAETHLHYDAQADLIRILSEQDAASKVIYTTHSAGCLPFDLGTGIRVVRMNAGDRSDVDNAFWSAAPGFTPLVMAMGAAALAFTPTRRAVIGEGITESILLPTLLRESVDPKEVDYQVAPGLAHADVDVINSLDLEASRVAFLCDGDRSGRDRRASMIRLGVPPSRILLLGMPSRRNVVLEDLIDGTKYRAAVNAELATWNPGKVLPASAIASRGRVEAVAQWCKTQGVEPPDKKRVAAQLLQLRQTPLSSPTGRAVLRELHGAIRLILDTPRLGLSGA